MHYISHYRTSSDAYYSDFFSSGKNRTGHAVPEGLAFLTFDGICSSVTIYTDIWSIAVPGEILRWGALRGLAREDILLVGKALLRL